MPYSIVNDHPECDGFAVIKDNNREVLGCHKTKAQAQEQLTAINIAEYGTRALPANYRPALSDDVPEGRACGNCFFYDESRQNDEGDKAWCTKWEDFVDGGYYCNAWAVAQESRQESYKPTEAMRVEAQKGLDWRSEYGRGGTEIGIARARDIANGRSLPLETVMRMVSFFARHEVDKQAEGFSPGEDGYPSNGRIAWALWGGDPGKSWADRIAEQNREYKDEEDDKPRYNKAFIYLQNIQKRNII